jgi:Uma2 family endonuclease
MVSALPTSQQTEQQAEIIYPSSDGEPLAETSVHIDAILNTVVALRHYFAAQEAIVLTNQFLYYAQGFPKIRVAPDVMVIDGVAPGPRDNYKIWEEKQVPSVVFEMTSAGTRSQDQEFKKELYAQLGVKEYWLFDPKGEWIAQQLEGYQLYRDVYVPITDSKSQALKLRLAVEGSLIGFYREDTGEKLLIPDELVEALRQERLRTEQERLRAEEAEAKVEQLQAQLRALGVEPT